MKKLKSRVHHARKKRAAAKKSSHYAHKKKHHKPFRVRHVSLIVVALVVGLGSTFQLGVYYGKSQSESEPLQSQQPSTNRVVSVRSAFGYSFVYDNELVSASGTEITDSGVRTVPESELRTGKDLISTTLTTKSGTTAARDAAAQLSFTLNNDTAAVTAARSATPTVSDEQIAANLTTIASDSSFNVSLLSQANETLSGVKTIKRVYQYTPNFGSGQGKVYSVQWSGVLQDRAFSLHLQGLVGDTSTPAALQTVFDSLVFDGVASGEVLGLSTSAAFGLNTALAQELESTYVVDSISPAVVKIYHATCGTLVVFGERLGNESCDFGTGSGFFVSSDGYIATNGHVVGNNAEDIFIKVLAQDSNLLRSFLVNVVGLDNAQIASLFQNPALLAALIVEIYELPENEIRLENESHTYFVALGEEPLEVTTIEDVYTLRDKADSGALMKAKLIDSDFDSKDLYVIGSGDEEGFSSSDVAILKLTKESTPFVKLFDGTVTQNMSIAILGFPGDADNQLTDNSKLSTSVTNGTVSAIREAAGGKYTIYQSDADASQGNSGGPVITASGEVLGLLTYRYKNDTSVDAAKSYIRAVEDLKALASNNSIEFAQDGDVQETWEKGLKLYSTNRFSKAVKEFEKVKESYGAHRLVNTYIANAEKAIADGKDVKDFPVLIAAAATTALIGIGAGIVLTVRHRGHHQAYKMQQTTPSGPVSGAGPMPPQAGSFQQNAMPQSPQSPVQQPTQFQASPQQVQPSTITPQQNTPQQPSKKLVQ